MIDIDISIIQEDGTAITVNTSQIDEDVIRTRCGLDIKEENEC